MATTKTRFSASVAAMTIGAVLLSGCGEDDASSEAPGELIDRSAQPYQSTSAEIVGAFGVSGSVLGKDV